MSEPEHEHDEDEGAESPVSLETVSEADEEEADAEAAETFSEDATEGSEGEPEMSAQPGTAADAKAQRDAQKRMERTLDRLEAEATRHANRLSEIDGELAQEVVPCPMCAPYDGRPNLSGFLLPLPPTEEQVANVRTAIGLAPKIDYKEDPHSKVCDTCGGLRQVKPTGLEYGDTLLPCADCNSLGWVPTDEKRGGTTPNGASATGITGPTVTPAQLEPELPEIAALRQAGYTVIAPYTANA